MDEDEINYFGRLIREAAKRPAMTATVPPDVLAAIETYGLACADTVSPGHSGRVLARLQTLLAAIVAATEAARREGPVKPRRDPTEAFDGGRLG